MTLRILLGPILWIMDSAPVNVWWGIAFTGILLPSLFLFVMKRRWWAPMVSLLALLLWLLLGILGESIDA